MTGPAQLGGRRARRHGLAAVGRAGAVLACGLALLSGCSGDPDGAPPSDSGSIASATPTDDPPAGPDESEPPGTEPAESATTLAPTVESTADRSAAPPAEVIRVVRVSTTPPDAGGAERIVIDTAGGTPGYRLRYVDFVRVGDEPVDVEGNAFLELVLESADPTGDQGLADDVAVDLLPAQPLLKQVQWVYYLGDQLTYAIGLDRLVPFTVTTAADQIVITVSA